MSTVVGLVGLQRREKICGYKDIRASDKNFYQLRVVREV